MAKPRSNPTERTYPRRSAARLTGLSAEVLRAWERRHHVVEPPRTPGGTRRYRASDLERLRLLKGAVDAGHRIGRLAGLSDAEVERLGSEPRATAPSSSLSEAFAAIDALDGDELQRLLSIQLSTLGPLRFAREIALPLAREIGERWASQRLGIAAEHLATAALRAGLPAEVHLWIGGSGAPQVARPQAVECIESLDALEQRVGLLAFEKRER